MGYKNVCLDCRKGFNLGTDFTIIRKSSCPECGKPMELISHRFRPPKKTDEKKWEVVRYLINNGFRYEHVYEKIVEKNGIKSYENYVKYPESMKEAKQFVEKYHAQKEIER